MRLLPIKLFLSYLMVMAGSIAPAWSETLTEQQIKAAFIYNFASYTEWPDHVTNTLRLCVYGNDSFGDALDSLQEKSLATRKIQVLHNVNLDEVSNCELLFIADSSIDGLSAVLPLVATKPILTIADTHGFAKRGVMLNMTKTRSLITFEANIAVVKSSGLKISAKLLRVATEVIQ